MKNSGIQKAVRLSLGLLCLFLATTVLATDSDSDGFDDAVDPFPTVATLPKQTYQGSYAFDGGYSNAIPAGDVDRDGYTDLVMGRDWDNGDTQNHGGVVRVISGKTRHLLYSVSHATGAYGSVGAVGDINGDGYADFATIAWSETVPGHIYTGVVWIYSGKTGELLRTHYGYQLGSNTGYLRRTASLGDINHDGFDDYALATDAGGSGTCYGGVNGVVAVVDGRTGNLVRVVSDACKPVVSNAGDVNGDGTPDMIVGEMYALGGNGRARVFSGADGSQLYSFNSATAWSYMGMNVAGAGDVNADGYADLIVASESIGYQVFSGKTGARLYTNGGVYTGSVSAAGDVDHDGYADFAAGNYSERLTGYGMGWVRVYSGRTGGVLETFRGLTTSHYFGTGISYPGDINGDGQPDLIVNSLLGNGTSQQNFTSYVITQTQDDDGDGFANGDDGFPRDASRNGIDTDGDGIEDLTDTDDDNDGVSDADEINIYHTDPKNPDTDGDGLSDGWEVAHGHDPNKADYQVASGGEHSCALSINKVKCWGDNTYGQSTVPALSAPKLVTTGKAHSCSLDGNTIKCWGSNSKGQTTVPSLNAPTYVAAGAEFTCALDANVTGG